MWSVTYVICLVWLGLVCYGDQRSEKPELRWCPTRIGITRCHLELQLGGLDLRMISTYQHQDGSAQRASKWCWLPSSWCFPTQCVSITCIEWRNSWPVGDVLCQLGGSLVVGCCWWVWLILCRFVAWSLDSCCLAVGEFGFLLLRRWSLSTTTEDSGGGLSWHRISEYEPIWIHDSCTKIDLLIKWMIFSYCWL